jgi:hypothetical protein
MGKDRDYRVIIPGALLLLSFFLTALGAGGFKKNPFTGLDGQYVTALVLLVVAHFGGGFLCSNVTVALLYLDLLRTRRDQTSDLRVVLKKKDASDVAIWGLAHTKFHRQAAADVGRFTAGRNTAMYACFNSIIALVVGWFLAFVGVLVGWLPDPTRAGWITIICFLIFLVVMAILLFVNGRRAAGEGWQVFIRSI